MGVVGGPVTAADISSAASLTDSLRMEPKTDVTFLQVQWATYVIGQELSLCPPSHSGLLCFYIIFGLFSPKGLAEDTLWGGSVTGLHGHPKEQDSPGLPGLQTQREKEGSRVARETTHRC